MPVDGPLGLPHDALRPYAVCLLAVCAAVCVVIAFGRRPPAAPRRLPAWLPVLAAALAVRALASLAVDGQLFDVLVAYRDVGQRLLHGGEVWTGTTQALATYPPTSYAWWALASLVPAGHPHVFAALVRAPFWVADSLVAVLLLRALPGATGRRAAWVYALCPVAVAVPTLHGQADGAVDLLLAVAMLLLLRGRLQASGLAAGAAIAVKQWPVFFLPTLLAATRRGRVRLLLLAAAPALLAFALYGAWHPQDALRGLWDVATYRPHRTGLGTALIFPVPAGPIVVLNALAAVAGAALGILALRRGRGVAEAMALDMLVFVALSPTVYDQYLVWAVPFLLLAGRVRTVALLGIGLLPAVASINLWTSQNQGTTPDVLLALSSLSIAAAAISLLPVRWERWRTAGRPLTSSSAA